MIDRLFDFAFSQGCGISLRQVLRSRRYHETLRQMQLLFVRYSGKSALGLALRKGHWRMGHLLNVFPEKVALEQAQLFSENSTPDFHYRALLKILGQNLMASAIKALPPKVSSLANEWPQATSERQLEILRRVGVLISNDRDKTKENLGQRWYDGVVNSDPTRYLPRLLPHRRDPDLNCLGRLQMNLAFGRLVRAPLYLALPLLTCNGHFESWKENLRIFLYREHALFGLPTDILDRHFPNDDWRVALEIQANYANHSFAVLQLCDGRWVGADSKNHTIFFRGGWKLPTVFDSLHYYQDVLPGLTIISNDGNFSHRWFCGEMESVADCVEAIHELMVHLMAADINKIEEIAATLFLSKGFRFILRLHGASDLYVGTVRGRLEAACFLLFGPDQQKFERFCNDAIFRRQELIRLVSTLYSVAINRFVKKWFKELYLGNLSHPVCSFGHPEYQVALSILLSCGYTLGMDDEDSRFFKDHGFDQTQSSMLLSRPERLSRSEYEDLRSVFYSLPYRQQRVRTLIGHAECHFDQRPNLRRHHHKRRGCHGIARQRF